MKKVLLTIFLLLCVLPSQAQKTYNDVDSTLYRYYRWCNNHIRDSVVLLTTDTLFRLSVEKKDVRMQAVVYSLKADHYYFTGQLDSLKAWIPRVEAFARSHDQLRYYYFTWSRLILYYTRRAQYTLAQYELERYLKQASRDDYKPATADAYKQLAHIYRRRGSKKIAAEYYQKAIDYITENELDDFSVPNLYAELAAVLIDTQQLDEAAEAIEKGKASVTLSEHMWPLKVKEVHLLANRKKIPQAKALLREIKQGHNAYTNQIPLLEAELAVRNYAGEYGQALATLDTMVEFYRQDQTGFYDTIVNYSKYANIYKELGKFKDAYKNLQIYTNLYRKKVSDDNERTLGEFATLLEVSRLDREKIEAEELAQKERLRRSRSVIAALIVILLLAGLSIAALTRMNRRLARAKRAAEKSDRMKGIFIRNITHEINTPLNAIVGFSELAAATPENKEERQSYISIIQENSSLLQKIVDDMLYISDLESTDTPPALAPTDIDECCRTSIRKVTEENPECPEIRFVPKQEAFAADTSRLMVVKLLTELLRNAVRFAPGGPVTLDWTADENRGITFSVTDSGPGIPPSEAERIFERFVKLDPFSQGMGLGLAVCRLITDALGSEIRLDTSYAGGGARFVVNLATGPETTEYKDAHRTDFHRFRRQKQK